MKLHEIVDIYGRKHTFNSDSVIRVDEGDHGDHVITLTRGEPIWVTESEWDNVGFNIHQRFRDGRAFYERDISAREKANALEERAAKQRAKGK